MPCKISKQEIENTILNVEYIQKGNQLIVAIAELKNGFYVTSQSGTIDAENFSREIGEQVAYNHLLDKVWELEGYRKWCESQMNSDPELRNQE